MKYIRATFIAIVIMVISVFLLGMFFVSCQEYRYVAHHGEVIISNNKARVVKLDSQRLLPKDTILPIILIYKKPVKVN